MNIAIYPVTNQDKNILNNLYSLYLHDLSAYTENLDIDDEGNFNFEEIDTYWDIDGFAPYLIKIDDKLIGFIILLRRPLLKKQADFAVNDLFILNKYRKKGIGKEVMKKVFFENRGNYFIVQLGRNIPAISFWKHIYESFHIEFEEKTEIIDGEKCSVQIFSIK